MRPLAEVAAHPEVKCVKRGEDGGMYLVTRGGRQFAVVASYGMGWDHLSISLPHRTPTWAEMERIKRIFFRDDEWAMQLHAPPSKHISVHPHTLHVWAPQRERIPIPPGFMV